MDRHLFTPPIAAQKVLHIVTACKLQLALKHVKYAPTGCSLPSWTAGRMTGRAQGPDADARLQRRALERKKILAVCTELKGVCLMSFDGSLRDWEFSANTV